MEITKMDKETVIRRKEATKKAAWKIAYYVETMRNGKPDAEARQIADRFIERRFL